MFFLFKAAGNLYTPDTVSRVPKKRNLPAPAPWKEPMNVSVFTALKPLVLASGSPRRQEFLRGLGLAFTVAAPTAPEPLPTPRETPQAFALRAARAKAAEVAPLYPAAAVIAADTVVALEDEIMGKPASEDEAVAMLRRLAGRGHVVCTGCCLRLPEGREEAFCATSEVIMRAWPDAALRAYAAGGEPADKAGAYAIQGQGAFLVEQISGSWTNIVGLPLAELLDVLLVHGVIAPAIDGLGSGGTACDGRCESVELKT